MRYVLIPIAVLALAGCGGDGDDSGGSTTTSAAAAGTAVTMSLVDFALEPKTVQLDSAGPYTFMVTNDGQTTHALEIASPVRSARRRRGGSARAHRRA